MFPLKDSNPTYRFPLVTMLLILINVLIFIIEIILINPEFLIENYALIPSKVNFYYYSSLKLFITSQFLHAGFLHIISNMWFLKIFGDNVEEKFGSFLFLIVYLVSGVFGGLMQYLFSSSSNVPMLGASGAVAGILGAYLVFFPNHKITTLIPIGFYWTTIDVSSYFMLVYWFFTQLFSGVGSIVDMQSGGIAFWAHVGGFISGYLIAKIFKRLGNSDVEEGHIIDNDFSEDI